MQGDIGMVKVLAQGKTFYCESGANLRKVLLENKIDEITAVAGGSLQENDDLYNGGSTVVNCRGIGFCATYVVKVEGERSAANWLDKRRRSLPPHSPTRNLRLACQTQVLGDVRVTKFDGFWGQTKQIVWS